MFADPQSVTINAVAQSLARTTIEGRKSTYQKADGTWTMTISHQLVANDRVRTLVRLDQKAIVADPLTAVNDYDRQDTYLVVERPLTGFSLASLEQQVAGFVAWFTQANVDKLYGLEV